VCHTNRMQYLELSQCLVPLSAVKRVLGAATLFGPWNRNQLISVAAPDAAPAKNYFARHLEIFKI
jgi:hypothetical protein